VKNNVADDREQALKQPRNHCESFLVNCCPSSAILTSNHVNV